MSAVKDPNQSAFLIFFLHKVQDFEKLFRSKEWVILSHRQDLQRKSSAYLYKNCRICAIHFEDCMFTSPLKNRLNPEAKPTVFEIPNPPPRIGCKRRITQRTINEDVRKGKKVFFQVYGYQIRRIICYRMLVATDSSILWKLYL